MNFGNTPGTVMRMYISVYSDNETFTIYPMSVAVTTATSAVTINRAYNASLYYADNKGAQSRSLDTRSLYLDVYTQPGDAYAPTTIKMNAPETSTGSRRPDMTICSAKIIYTGSNLDCVQASLVNDKLANRIEYLQS